MIRCTIILFVLFFFALRINAQEKFVRSDTCLLLLPVKVYYRDDAIRFISDCEVKKFFIVISDMKGNWKWKRKRLRHDNKSYYIKLHYYRTGLYKWNIKYTMIINGDLINKETYGTVEFLN